MKKRIFYPLFCCCAFLSLPLMAQQSPLLEKYRMMALDYNHDLKAAEKNIAASVEIEKSAKETQTFGSCELSIYRQPVGVDFGCPFYRIVEDGGRKAIELWRLSFSFATDLYGRTCIGVYPYGETSTIIGKQSGGGTE